MKKFFAIIFFVVFSLSSFAQQLQQAGVNTNLSDAIRFYRSGFADKSYGLFRKIVEEDPSNVTALTFLGEIKVEQKKWGEAIDWFKKLLELDEQSLLAQYFLGISYREQGKYKAFLLQKLDWSKSRRYFEAVFLKEPMFRDVFYQYAILQRYKKEFFFAVDRAERQIDHTPSNINVIVGTHHLYDLLLYHENPEKVRNWLQEREGFRAELYQGESYRRDGDYARADSIFSRLLASRDSTISKTPLLLALARLKYQQGKPEECERWYNQSVDSIRNKLDAMLLFEDTKFVFSDEEYQQFQRIYRAEDFKKFFKKFWVQRNPMPGARDNLRLIEHFRRLIYSEQNYRYDGVRSWVNSPDKQRYLVYPQVFFLNDRFNDKGLIYIRHGEPQERAVDVAGKYGIMPSGAGETATVSNESWLYYQSASQPKRIFHFLIDENATGNNWQLSAILPTNLLENRLEWDSIYHRMYFAEQDNDIAELSRLEVEMARQSRKDVYAALSSDSHSWNKEINPIIFPFYVSTFRGDYNKTRYEIYYGLSGPQLWPNEMDFNQNKEIELGFAAYDMDWNQVFRQNKTIRHNTIKSIIDSATYFVDQYSFESVPKELYMNLFVRMPERNGIGGYRFKYGYAIYSVKDLKVSGIALANKITPATSDSKYVKNNLEIIPNPFLTFVRSEPVNVYFEVYNLSLSPAGRATFDIEYRIKLLQRTKQNLFRKIRNLFGRNQSEISNKLERYSDSSTSIEYLALDLRDHPAGEYQLTVIATDKSTSNQSESKIKFKLK